jgi:hypothetical protein
MNLTIIISFLLGLFHTEFVSLMNSILKHPMIVYTSPYFNFIINIFSFIFKYLFYFYLIYTLYYFLNFYINFDEIFINNMAILSFDDLDNFSKTIDNTTPPSLPNWNIDIIVENIPKGVASYGAYKLAMESSKIVPSIGGKFLIGAIAAVTTILATSFSLTAGEIISKKYFESKNKTKFILDIFNNNNIDNLDTLHYKLLLDMSHLLNFDFSFFFILLNLIIVDSIKHKNILDYIPSFLRYTKLLKLIEFIWNRYIQFWSKSRSFMFILSSIFMFFILVLLKLGFYIIFYF